MKHRIGIVIALLLLVSFAVAQDAPRYGIPIDWSSRHVVSSAANNVDLEQAIRRDPRQVYNWMMHNRTRLQQQTTVRLHGSTAKPLSKKGTTAVDWSFPLGAGTVPIHSYPAKYSFDAGTGTPSCTGDYVVYGLNVTGSSSQPNVVQLNNIYAGTAGLCGTNPTLKSAYNTTTITGGIVQVSPALSMDGTQVALIESGSAGSSFHVLTWGTTGNNGTFSSTYTAVKPSGSMTTTTIAGAPAGAIQVGTTVTITTTSAHNYTTGEAVTISGVGVSGYNGTFVITATPSATSFQFTTTAGLGASGGGTAAAGNNAAMTSLAFGTTGTTYSSPYIDYATDRAYFGDDNGKLYRTTCVFFCAGSPALDTSWPVTVAAAGTKMSPPVYDSNTNKVFVGGSDGKLYLLDLAQCPGANCTIAGGGLKSITVGVNNANGGVFDGVILDSTFETMFVFAGDTGAGNANGLMMQTDVNFSFTLTVPFGSPPFPIYAGALDDAYYQNSIGQTVSATVPTGNVFSCGALGGSKQPDLYWTTFTATAGTLSTSNPPKMNTAGAAISKKNVPGNPGIGCNPLTEFKNGTTDRLFLSQSTLSSGKCFSGSAADGCVMMYDITTPSSTIGNSPLASATENAGTSGIVVDNASGSAQASSLYFANEGTAQCTTGAATPSYCAVKLTQSLFQ